MPGSLRSTELAYKARERIPDLAVLFTSGYTEDAMSTSGRLAPNIELLPKPYTRETLARKVRHVLGNTAQRQSGRGERRRSAIAAARPAPRKKFRVLVCEDDAAIRESFIEMLQSMGHEATPTANGRAALSVLSLICPDILLTDVGLPDITGTTLAQQALAQLPSLSVIFASGTAVDPAVPGYRRAGTLLKPFTFDALFAAVSAIETGTEAGAQ